MNPLARLGQLGPAVRLLLLFTLLLGIGYPLLVTGIGQVAFHSQANGSLVEQDGKTVGSSLIGQAFGPDDKRSAPYFWSRPSAAGDGYDPRATGASNLALDNPDLVKAVRERQQAIAEADGIAPGAVAPDAVLASGSGLDPHISPAYAAQQLARVAKERGLSPADVRRLVAAHTQGRTLGILGEARVNVLELNLSLDRLAATAD